MTMIDLASQSSEVPADAKKFGTKEVNLSQFQMLYNLVECTPDLSSTDCNTCLQAVRDVPVYRMVDTVPTPTPELPPLPLPLPLPPGSPSGPKGQSQIRTVTIVTIVAPIAVSVVQFFFG
ncbi:cysteine-rich receptor-like protein kinase 10 [Fagus crenata]